MKLKLDVAEMAEEFFQDAHLLGIVAPIRDYQFCWYLNQVFRFRFRANNDIEIQMTKKSRSYYFPIYEYAEPNSSWCITFIRTIMTANTFYQNSVTLIFSGS